MPGRTFPPPALRAGVIGEIGADRWYVSAAEERSFRAAARAHLRTGLTISTHAARWPVGLEQLRLLTEEGADPRRVIIGHADSVPLPGLPPGAGQAGLLCLLRRNRQRDASRAATFWRITFPLSLPGVIAGFVFVLIPTTGEFIAPLLVGGPNNQLFGNSIQAFFSNSPDWNYGSVLAMTLIVVVVVLTLVFGRFLRTDLRAGTGAGQ
jgi:hypothetical protein